jgi:thioredoxin reductase
MTYDTVIVGTGPAGLSTALTLGRARRATLLIDGGPGRNAPSRAVHNDDVRR